MKKILIVEDEQMLSEMYQDVFSREGFEVVPAFTGQEAREVAKTEKPDFILLDILLPGDDGVAFLKKKKEDPDIASIPVIAFSNFDDPEIRKQAFQLGVQDYLIKTNYTPQELIKKVEKYIGPSA